MTDRPEPGPTPDYIAKMADSIGGLSRPASTLGLFLLQDASDDHGTERMYRGEELANVLGLAPEDVNDAVDELKEHGLAQTIDYMGTHPFEFGQVGPTYALYLHLKDALSYDPDADAKTVAAAVVAMGDAEGPALGERTGLPPGRLNRAVEYLEDFGRVRVLRFKGTAPYSFGSVAATRHTREFVR